MSQPRIVDEGKLSSEEKNVDEDSLWWRRLDRSLELWSWNEKLKRCVEEVRSRKVERLRCLLFSLCIVV